MLIFNLLTFGKYRKTIPFTMKNTKKKLIARITNLVLMP